MDAISTATDDPEVEKLRRASVGLFVLLVVAVFGGYFASLLVFGLIRRLIDGFGFLVVPLVGIVMFWAGLLAWTMLRRTAARSTVLLMAAALVVAVGILLGTIALTSR